MTILAQTFTAECDSSSKQLAVLRAEQQRQRAAEAALLEEYKDQMENSEQQLLLSQGECNMLRLDLKQIKGDLDNTTNNQETLVGHLKIKLSTLQETHLKTLEQLESVEREQKSLQECMAADQKKIKEKIAELDAAKIVISDFQAKLEAQSEESTAAIQDLEQTHQITQGQLEAQKMQSTEASANIQNLQSQFSNLQWSYETTMSQLQTTKTEKESLEAQLSAEKKSLQEKTVELAALKSVESELSAQSVKSSVIIQSLQSQLQMAKEEQQTLEIQISVKEGLLQQNTAELRALKDVQSEMTMQSAKAPTIIQDLQSQLTSLQNTHQNTLSRHQEELSTERKKVQENAVKLAALKSVESDTSTRSATEASDQLSALQEAHRATQIERDNLQVQYDQALKQTQEAHLELDQAQKLVGKLSVEKSMHEDAITKLKQRISALEGKVSVHPAQSNETTQAELSAAEYPSDEDVVLDVADQNGYEPDTESEDDSDRMPIDGDDMPSTTNSRPARYKGQQQTVSDFADGRPYRAGKQKESSPDPSMPVDYRVNSYYRRLSDF
ncbi:hypothetical protein C0992_008172 [Termitomyces sp. T32_za158]|nr:hypothetical protein C0992_008172 [Termitomyces sp. T32_za158]